MEIVAILRLLWPRRFLVALGALAAIGSGAAALRSAPRQVAAVTWVASARALVDTSDSQLVNVDPKGVDTVPIRARLGADLVAADSGKASLARAAGVRAPGLDVLSPAVRAEPPAADELVTHALAPGRASHSPYVVSLYADGVSPIVAIEASGANRQRTLALADASIRALRTALEPDPARAGAGFTVDTIARPRATEHVHRSRRALFAVAGAVAAFAAWCSALLVCSGIARRARRTRVAS